MIEMSCCSYNRITSRIDLKLWEGTVWSEKSEFPSKPELLVFALCLCEILFWIRKSFRWNFYLRCNMFVERVIWALHIFMSYINVGSSRLENPPKWFQIWMNFDVNDHIEKERDLWSVKIVAWRRVRYFEKFATHDFQREADDVSSCDKIYSSCRQMNIGPVTVKE